MDKKLEELPVPKFGKKVAIFKAPARSKEDIKVSYLDELLNKAFLKRYFKKNNK